MSLLRKLTLIDAAGNAIGSTQLQGSYNLDVAMQQEVVADAKNSFTGTLSASASFTGSATSTLGMAGIQVTLKTNQNCTVQVQQSPEGTNWDISDSFNYRYTFGGASWTVQAVNSYVRVIVTNLSSTASATDVRLQTCLCPVVEAVPRKTDADGYFQAAVKGLSGRVLGKAVHVSPMNAMKVAEGVRLAGAGFSGSTLDPNFWTPTLLGTGSASLSLGALTLTTGTGTATNTVRLQSVRVARYVSGSPNTYRGQIALPAVTGTNTRRWGAFSTIDGFFFEHDGTTLSVVARKNSSDANKVSSGSFNGDLGSTVTVDANLHTYEIFWTNKMAYFVVDDVLVHTIAATTTSNVSTLSLPVAAENNNAAGNTNANTMTILVCSISRLGPLESDGAYLHIASAQTTVAKYASGRLHAVVVNSGKTTSTLTVIDGTTTAGATMAVIDTSNFGNFTHSCPFYTGLVLVATGTSDVTVIYE